MDWKILEIEELKKLRERIDDSNLIGCDTSLVNLFLLQKNYETAVSISQKFLFRYYNGTESHEGYGFPIPLLDSSDEKKSSNFDLKESLNLIFEDAEKNFREVKFCFLTEKQKNQIDECVKFNFPNYTCDWKSNRDDSDYLYERKFLAELPGKSYHKKKNHVSKFCRNYEGRWEFRSLSLCNISDDMISVAESWLAEREEKTEILQMELESIKLAVANKEIFKVEGGVLYVDGKPCAMTLASRISAQTMDIHYEKCLSEAASNGAYAAINWCFSGSCPDFVYFNREEDLGIEGLRKAKLSYHPQIILDKYYGSISK